MENNNVNYMGFKENSCSINEKSQQNLRNQTKCCRSNTWDSYQADSIWVFESIQVRIGVVFTAHIYKYSNLSTVFLFQTSLSSNVASGNR